MPSNLPMFGGGLDGKHMMTGGDEALERVLLSAVERCAAEAAHATPEQSHAAALRLSNLLLKLVEDLRDSVEKHLPVLQDNRAPAHH